MARRIRFQVAQPIIIIGWYISSFLLLGILIGLGVLMYEPQNAGHVYTQAYFYGTFAAGLYFIIASLLVVTAWGAHKGHYSREYKLTTSQRTLMLQTIILFIYLLGGSAVYARIEGWKFMDAVYWADYTLLTIGIGNFAPVTHLGRGLLFPYAVGGIVILGLIISSIRTLMLEHGRQKIADLLTARTHKFLVKQALSERNNRLVPNLRVDENEGTEFSDRERQKREFITMRRVRQLAEVQHKWISLITSLVVWMALWLIGAAIFWRSEVHIEWTYFQALYFAYTTLLTIGFGDFYPVSSLGKAFFVFWSLLAVPTITILISNISDTLIRFVKDITLFIGEVTILPGDEPLHDRIKDIFHISWRDKWLQESAGEENDSQDILTDTGNGTDRNARRHAVEAEEHKKEESARRRGDIATENVHHYHYLLFREIRKMMELATKNLSKEFDYLEWEYYLALISGQHKPPYESNTEQAKEDVKRQEKFRDWSWIDKKNPLLGDKSEVEWLLNALTEALERELKMASRDYHSPDASDKDDCSAVSSGNRGDEGLESGNARGL
jgi:potassium channel subfamily K